MNAPRFWTECDLRILEDCGPRPLVMLLQPLQFESTIVGNVTCPEGFRFDGASIPQVAMWATGWPAIRAACVHDWLLSEGRHPRSVCDRVFLEALQVCGVEANTAELMYAGVRAYTMMQEPPRNDEQVGA